MTVVNQVPTPPLQVPILDNNGRMSKPWAIFNRELYNYLAYKGGNSISGLDVRVAANEEQIALNVAAIAVNAAAISVNADNIQINADDIADLDTNFDAHVAADAAHGSNGDIVGFNDLATEILRGLVLQMDLVNNAVNSSTSAVGSANAQTGVYVQADVQSIADLANSTKTAVNTLVTDVNNVVTQLNDLIAKSKTAGQMNTV